MVRLLGPTLGGQASGSLADTITFSKSKRQAYAKMKASPRQPNTASQIAMKAALKGLSAGWKNIGSAAQATWLAEGNRLNISPFNAYLQYNLAQFRRGLPPTAYIMPGYFMCSATWAAPTYTKLFKTVRFTWNITARSNLWYVVIAKRFGPGDLWSWFNLASLTEQRSTGTRTFLDRHPTTGTTEYRFYLASLKRWYSTIEHKVSVTFP